MGVELSDNINYRTLSGVTGASVVDMQNAGRWKSSQMPARYAKAELAERGAIARFKYGKGK